MEQILGSSSSDVLAAPVPGGRSLTTDERRNIDLSDRIKGWGSDLDPRVRPGVPRDKAPELGSETLYPPIEAQVPRVKIHKSTEHGQLTQHGTPLFHDVAGGFHLRLEDGVMGGETHAIGAIGDVQRVAFFNFQARQQFLGKNDANRIADLGELKRLHGVPLRRL